MVCPRRRPQKAVTVANEFGVVRQLCLYRRRVDPLSYVPEHALEPVKESIFLPYIFSHDEVRRVLVAARSHDGRFIRGSMLQTLLRHLDQATSHARRVPIRRRTEGGGQSLPR